MQNTQSNSGNLDPKALADRWGMQVSTLSNWRNLGKGPSYRKIGGKVLYLAADISAYESSALRTSASRGDRGRA